MEINKTMKKIQIDEVAFLDWYFDWDETRNIGESVRYHLIKNGVYKITAKDILNNTGYVPVHFIIDYDEKEEYYDKKYPSRELNPCDCKLVRI